MTHSYTTVLDSRCSHLWTQRQQPGTHRKRRMINGCRPYTVQARSAVLQPPGHPCGHLRQRSGLAEASVPQHAYSNTGTGRWCTSLGQRLASLQPVSRCRRWACDGPASDLSQALFWPVLGLHRACVRPESGTLQYMISYMIS